LGEAPGGLAIMLFDQDRQIARSAQAVDDLSMDRVALDGRDRRRGAWTEPAAVSGGWSCRAATEAKLHAQCLPVEAGRLFIVCPGGLEESGDQLVVNNSGGVEMLDSAPPLLCVGQRKDAAFFKDFDVVAHVTDGHAKGFCDLARASGLACRVKDSEYPTPLG
jgi:hypothetical protein